MEFTSADIFQHSPLGDVLDSLRFLSLLGDPRPNYARLEREAGDEGIRCPPTTHFIATVDDLTDVLDFDSEDIDGMDDDAGEEQEPPPTGRWTATSLHDIYMVDTPKENNDEERKNAAKDNPLEKQPKRQRRRRSKSRLSKNGDNSARENNTPVDSRGNDDHIDPAIDQDEPANSEHSTDPLSEHGDTSAARSPCKCI